jgi:hypothetical protein
VNLAQRVYEIAVEEEFPLGTFALLLVEAHIVADDYAGAVETVEELADEEPAWLAESKAIFASLRAIAHLGVGADEVADLHLQEFLNESGMRVETMLAVSRRLVDLEAFQQADRVLSQAYGTNPSNQAALSELIRLEMLTGSTARLSDLLSDLLEMRRPDYDLVVNAYETLGSDRFLFAPNREEILVELNSILESRGALAAQDA